MPAPRLIPADRLMPAPRLMGVLNVTPDSFSDGGKFTAVAAALLHAKQLIAEGASVIDVGGESTRPGATRLTAAQEQARVLPVLEALASLPEVADGQVAISIDTLNSSTAMAAIAAGASIVNDVSGGKADPQMFSAVAASATSSRGAKSVTYVLGHWANFEAGAGAVQQTNDIVGDVVAELAARVELATAAGVNRDCIVVDPGLGFGKDSAQNWQLIEGLDQIAKLGLPILVGASRKRFVATAVAEAAGIDSAEVTVDQRDAATANLTAKVWQDFQASEQASLLWGFRVHNVQANIEALHAAAALRFAHERRDRQS